jgi:hypothetical protein
MGLRVVGTKFDHQGEEETQQQESLGECNQNPESRIKNIDEEND